MKVIIDLVIILIIGGKMQELKEQWKEVNGYRISNYGIIIGKKGQLLKLSKNKYGYIVCDLDFGYPYGRVKSLHRAVALVFIPNPENKSDVNHIDANKENCKVDNLEWNTRQENMTHSSINRLHPWTKAVCLIDKNGVVTEIYPSINELSRKYEISARVAYNCLRETRDNYFGLRVREYDLEKEDYIKTRFDNPDFKYKSTRRRNIKCVETGQIFKSQMEASKVLGINQSQISDYISGKRKSNVGGYTFEEIEINLNKG